MMGSDECYMKYLINKNNYFIDVYNLWLYGLFVTTRERGSQTTRAVSIGSHAPAW